MKRFGHRTHMGGGSRKKRLNRFMVDTLKRQAEKLNRKYVESKRHKD